MGVCRVFPACPPLVPSKKDPGLCLCQSHHPYSSLQLFESSKDPPVFSSKEPFDVLNDKVGHHGGCVATAPCRHPGGAAAGCQRFWPLSEVFRFSPTRPSLLSEQPLRGRFWVSLGKGTACRASLAQLCTWRDLAWVCPCCAPRKREPCFAQGCPGLPVTLPAFSATQPPDYRGGQGVCLQDLCTRWFSSYPVGKSPFSHLYVGMIK